MTRLHSQSLLCFSKEKRGLDHTDKWMVLNCFHTTVSLFEQLKAVNVWVCPSSLFFFDNLPSSTWETRESATFCFKMHGKPCSWCPLFLCDLHRCPETVKITLASHTIVFSDMFLLHDEYGLCSFYVGLTYTVLLMLTLIQQMNPKKYTVFAPVRLVLWQNLAAARCYFLKRSVWKTT